MARFAPPFRALGGAILLGTVLLAAIPSVTGTAAAHAGTDRDGRVSAIDWAWPLGPERPAVIRGFEPPVEPWLAGHRGVDLLGAPGSVVRSAARGTVTYAGPVAGIAVVAIAHGEIRTTYQPVRASVRVGDHVGAGTEIGALELAGSHCAPAACLHWGALRADTYLDPLALVGSGGRVRLAPLGRRALSKGAGIAATSAVGAPAGGSVSAAAGAGALAGLRSP